MAATAWGSVVCREALPPEGHAESRLAIDVVRSSLLHPRGLRSQSVAWTTAPGQDFGLYPGTSPACRNSALQFAVSAPSQTGETLQVIDLGRMGYAPAYEVQVQHREALVAARSQGDGEEPMCLLLVEHDPVITVSRRPGAGRHLIASPAELTRLGIEVCETDRGGDITYHGPGQIVAYPILDLQRLHLGVAAYLRLLEEIIIRTLARFGIEAKRDPAATGVWVDDPTAGIDGGAASAKIAALGIRVSRWVTMHGLALNVATNLDHYRAIVPCGLVGRSVTSLQRLLGDAAPAMDEVKVALVEEFRTAVSERSATVRRD